MCSGLVSVIIPVFMVEKYLAKCIESVLNQTYRNIEIILVDDGSPDRCYKVCDMYAQRDSRIVVIHQENKGVSGARNTGILQAKGEFVLFVDGDDELYLDAVDVLMQKAREYDADVVSGVKNVVGQNGSKSSPENGECEFYSNDEPLLLSLAGDKNTNSACAKLFKRAFIDEIFFEEGKNINEDGFFVFRCYEKKPRLVQYNAFVYQYNVRENSASRQSFSDKHLSILYFCERKKSIIEQSHPEYIVEAKNMEVRANIQMLDVLCSSNDRKYKSLQNKCIRIVKKYHKYHKPINYHHRRMEWVVIRGLYPLYKLVFRMKYCKSKRTL